MTSTAGGAGNAQAPEREGSTLALPVGSPSAPDQVDTAARRLAAAEEQLVELDDPVLRRRVAKSLRRIRKMRRQTDRLVAQLERVQEAEAEAAAELGDDGRPEGSGATDRGTVHHTTVVELDGVVVGQAVDEYHVHLESTGGPATTTRRR